MVPFVTRLTAFMLVMIAFLIATYLEATAATFHVTAGGLDADGCGTKTAPCRSISRAVAAAAAGDKIVVGPGRYGDLDDDGTLGEAGGSTVLTIDKRLVVESVEGAATTIIDGGGANRTVVRITASGARFGKAKKGFTVFDSSGAGIAVESRSALGAPTRPPPARRFARQKRVSTLDASIRTRRSLRRTPGPCTSWARRRP